MSNRYKIRDQRGLNYLTLTVVGWIDIFSRKKYRDIIIDSIKFCIAQKVEILEEFYPITG